MKWAGLGFHVLILGISGVCVAGGRVAFKDWYAHQLYRVSQKAAADGARQRQMWWRHFDYADGTDSRFVETFLAKIDWAGLDISDLQRSRLRARLAELIAYWQNPSFDEYYRLRTEGLRYRFKCSRAALYQVTNSMAKPGLAALPPDTKEMTKLVWSAVHSGQGHTKVPRLTGACLDQIAASISLSNTPWSLLTGKVAKPFTRAGEALNPGFTYSLAAPGSPAKASEPLFFHLSFFGKFGDSDNVGPVYVSLAWLPQDENWALSRMLADQWLNLRTVF